MSDDVFSQYAAAHGLAFDQQVATGPLTPLLVRGGGLAPAVKGPLADGPLGYLGRLAYRDEGGTAHHYNAGLTEIPESLELVPRLECVRKGRLTSNTHYGFEIRTSRLWTESVALNERYKVTTSPWQDPNWMRQLFSPSFIDWLATVPPGDFSFELTYGWLLCSVEQDRADTELLDALASATAEVAARVRRECLESVR